jgi:hypothetical protein
MNRPIVIVESPYAGDVQRNVAYLRAAMRHCLLKGEAPFASHALYTQPGVLDDTILEQRRLGIEAGFEFRRVAQKTVVYVDLGYPNGMKLGIDHAEQLGHAVEYRTLPDEMWAAFVRAHDGTRRAAIPDSHGSSP